MLFTPMAFALFTPPFALFPILILVLKLTLALDDFTVFAVGCFGVFEASMGVAPNKAMMTMAVVAKNFILLRGDVVGCWCYWLFYFMLSADYGGEVCE